MDSSTFMFSDSSSDCTMSLGSIPASAGSKKTLEEEAAPPDIPPHLPGIWRTAAGRRQFNTHLSLYFPNLPACPVNGMIKTYSDTSHRTFSRPYSAKTVFFYKDGDEYFTGVRVPISKARYRTMNSLMDSLNHNISLPYGVRRLHTPFGRTKIERIDQLKHLGRYVASSTKTVRKVNFESALEQKRLRQWQSHFSVNNQVDQQSGVAASTSKTGAWTENEQGLKVYKARMAANRHMGVAFLPITAKQMFFVLNGHPTRIYRTLINPLKRRDLNSLLEEVSEGLHTAIFKLYSYGGERIVSMEQLIAIKEPRALAVPRNERPNYSGDEALILPAIGNRLGKKLSRTSSFSRKTAKNSQTSTIKGNSLERQGKASKVAPPSTRIPQPHNSLAMGEKPSPMDSLFRLKQSSTEQPSNTKNSNKLVEIDENIMETTSETVKKSKSSESANRLVGHQSLPSSSNTMDSDSGRPKSTDLDDKSSEQQYNGRLFFDEEDEDEEEMENSNKHRPGSDADISEEDDYPELLNIDKEDDKLQREESEKNSDQEDIRRQEVKRIEEKLAMKENGSPISSAAEGEIIPAGELQLFHAGEPELILTKSELLSSSPASRGAIEADEQSFETSQSKAIKLDAATKIQKNWRGYAVRKNLKKTQFNDDLVVIPSEDENDQEEFLEKSNEAAEGQAPTGNEDEDFNQLLNGGDLDIAIEKRIDSGSDREEVHGTNHLIADMGGMLELSLSSEMLNKKAAKTNNVFTYSITVITGNRWAADTEADLYLIMYGDEAQSERLNLRQEYVNWLQSSEPKFRQNQSDSFQVDVPTRLGVIGRLTVGHEHTGYGAGIFIDRILVTEESDDVKGRQFLFLCNKWLDSGQVDGKVERNIRLSAFYNITSFPIDNRVTKGRWELIIHSGSASGEGGTTSNLNIVGYGTRGNSKTTEVYDSRMARVPSESLIQVDFGDIGELLKIRLELDGSGDSPDYFLNFVELKDLDTEEQFAVMCGKWLKWKNTDKGSQPFRELLAFHVGVEPLPLITYEGKLRLIPNKIQFSEPEIRMELYGDLGETGFIRLYFDENNNGIEGKLDEKIDVSFKVESVSIGRIYGARVFFDPTPMGKSLFEGFSVLQEIFQKNQVDLPKNSCQWMISNAIIRESTHTPYRYVLSHARLHRRVADEQPYIKELLTSEMEGISTKIRKKKAGKKVESNWILSMAITDNSSLLPVVMLCGDKKTMQMRNLDSTPTDNIISYQLKSSKAGLLRKIRVSVDKERLKIPHSEGGRIEDFVGIQKIRVCDTANGDELRFPTADIELTRFSVFEFSAIFPDQPPAAIVIYSIRVVTGKSTISGKNFVVRLNLNGEMGDIGPRALILDPDFVLEKNLATQTNLFDPDSINSFDIEAVSIGEVASAEVSIESDSKQEDFTWECKEIVVTDTNTSMFYVFKFSKLFSAKVSHQTTSVLPFTGAL